jgi:hypothetical protein
MWLGKYDTQRQKREVVLDRERGEILCSVVEASETIGRKEVIFLLSGVGGVNATQSICSGCFFS